MPLASSSALQTKMTLYQPREEASQEKLHVLVPRRYQFRGGYEGGDAMGGDNKIAIPTCVSDLFLFCRNRCTSAMGGGGHNVILPLSQNSCLRFV